MNRVMIIELKTIFQIRFLFNVLRTLVLVDSSEIPPGSTRLIGYSTGGAGGKNEFPEDFRSRYWLIDSLFVVFQDSLYEINLAQKELWEYTPRAEEGTYDLKIDTNILGLN